MAGAGIDVEVHVLAHVAELGGEGFGGLGRKEVVVLGEMAFDLGRQVLPVDGVVAEGRAIERRRDRNFVACQCR